MTRFLVTGASGLLGLNFSLQTCEQHEVIGVVNQNLLNGVPFEVSRGDLSREGEAARLLQTVRPEVVIHCAAMANVDACEAHPWLAQRMNAGVPAELANLTAKAGTQMVHISTDAVFDGVRGDYGEKDTPNPINHYARTKLAGEQAVAEANPAALIARVNFYGWSLRGQRSLAEWFFYNLSAGKLVNGFTDVYFCPLLVNDLVDVLLGMLEHGLAGLYHVVSPQRISKYDFGCAIARRFGLDESLIQPVSWREGGLRAARSPNLTLRVDKLRLDSGVTLPEVRQGLDRFYALHLAAYPERLRNYDTPLGYDTKIKDS